MSPARAKPGPADRGGIRLKILRRIWEVIEKVPLDFLKKAYSGLHDLDLDLAVQKVGETR